MLVDVSYRMSPIQPCASLLSAGYNNRIRGTMSGEWGRMDRIFYGWVVGGHSR
jgi:hypothetical protein